MGLVGHISIEGKLALLTLEGRIVSEEDITPLYESIDKVLAEGAVFLVCNAEQLTYCNSTGLNFFVRLLTKVRTNGGELALCGLQQAVDKLFQLSKLNEIFTCYPSVKEAQDNFNSIA